MTRFFALCVLSVAFSAAFAMGTNMTEAQGSMTNFKMYANMTEKQLNNDKVTPITRVVGLLEEMKVTLEQEMEDDKKIYGEMQCWCHNNIYYLQTSIQDATKRANRFKAQLVQLTSASNGFASSIGELMGSADEDNNTLYEATQIRKAEREKFQAFELMSINSIEQLKAAILVLGRHEAEGSVALPQLAFSFLQRTSVSQKSRIKSKGIGSDSDLGMQSDSQHDLTAFMDDDESTDDSAAVSTNSAPQAVAHPSSPPQVSQGGFLEKTTNLATEKTVAPHHSLLGGWSSSELATIRKAVTLMQKSGDSFTPKYESQSVEIQGLMKKMKQDMEADLVAAQKEELRKQLIYDKLRKAKLDAIQMAEVLEKAQKDEKTKLDNDMIWTSMDLENILITLRKDTESLMKVEKQCADEEAAFQKRKTDRTDEIAAVSETIDILTGDDARDAMNIAYEASGQKSASLLQLKSQQGHKQHLTNKAKAFLALAAKRTGSSNLAMLASRATLDKFEMVNMEIDKYIISLKREQKEEVKKNDWCKEELHKNEMDKLNFETDKKESENYIAELEQEIKELEDRIAEGRKDIKEMEKALADAKEQRAKEKAEYQEVNTNQKITMEVLNRAMDRLAKFYQGKKVLENIEKLTLAQQNQTGESAPSMFTTPVFTTPQPPYDASQPKPDQMEYKPHAGNVGVFAMFKKLIQDLEREMDDDTAEEKKSEYEYQEYKLSTKDAIYSTRKQVAEDTRQRAYANKERITTVGDLENTNSQLEDLAEYDKTTRDQCQYNIDNFAMRQQKRQEEIEALQQAKQILTGAATSAA